LRINKNIEAKSKLLLNPLFPTLKKEIIHLFIVSLPKVPEFWCFFSNTKLLIFGNFYFSKKSLNSFNKRIELEYIKIINGYLEGTYTINPDMPLKEIYYKKSKMVGKYIVYNTDRQILYRTYFTNGNGYWKDYYYKEGKTREEGKVVDHYKYGEWKYYNENGKIDSIKAYQLSDSVDVRFPHCLFNKNEPCY